MEEMQKVRNSRLQTLRPVAVSVLAAAVLPALFTAGRCDELRLSTMANCRLTVEDRDNGINPYDFGRNPAWLAVDFDYPWIRFFFGVEETSGELRREMDPNLISDVYAGFMGSKSLSDRQAINGRFTYGRLRDREVSRSLEIDQYNDCFYLTDLSTGDIEYYGPSTSVDYSLRLREDLFVGGGFDYDICTGLKDQYTKPQITHNYFKGNLGVIKTFGEKWAAGMSVSPVRIQNRTDFSKTDEGFDNVIRQYAGDAIYEVRTFSDYTISEVLFGYEAGLQGFYDGAKLDAGIIATYGMVENEIKFGSTYRYPKGYWKQDIFDVQAKARYTLGGMPLVLGAGAEIKIDDGWGLRPNFDEVLLYDNPFRLYSGSAGATWLARGINMAFTAEYTLNKFDIEALDYGANLFRESGIIQNIGRLAVEKRVFDIYSFRGGVEITDYPIDRWLKMPQNIDKYRYTAGFGIYTGGWEIDAHLEYAHSSHEILDSTRKDLAGIVWFTRIMQ